MMGDDGNMCIVNGENTESDELVCSFLRLPSSIKLLKCDPKLIYSYDISSTLLKRIELLDICAKHLIKQNDNIWYIIEKYYANTWVRWMVEKPRHDYTNEVSLLSNKTCEYPKFTIKEWENLQMTDLLKICKEYPHNYHNLDKMKYESQPLDMNLPHKPSSRVILKNISTTQDPSIYLQKKYYETLFNLGIHLQSFGNSKLVKLKSICRQNKKNADKLYEEVLSSMLLDMLLFEMRHDSSKFGILQYTLPSDMDHLRNKIMLELYQIDLSKELHFNLQEFSSILKMREIKLQIMIILELVYLKKEDDSFKKFEESYKSKLKEREINIARIKTSFIHKRNLNNNKQGSDESVDLCERMDLILDRMTIMDTLLRTIDSKEGDILLPNHIFFKDYKKKMLNKNTEASSTGFIGHVLVPCWIKRVPFAIEFISKKVKGPSLYGLKDFSHKMISSMEKKSVIEGKSKEGPYCNSINFDINSKFVSPTRCFPALTRSNSSMTIIKSNSNLGDFLESDTIVARKSLSTSRANYDVSINKLEKREMSMSDLTIDESRNKYSYLDTKPGVVNGNHITLKRSHTTSFQRIGKVKDEIKINKPSIDESFKVQVMATPLKLSPIYISKSKENIIKSPLLEIDEVSNSNTITKTPNDLKPINSLVPLMKSSDTPVNLPASKTPDISVHNKAISSTDNDMLIHSPAKRKKVCRRLFAP